MASDPGDTREARAGGLTRAVEIGVLILRPMSRPIDSLSLRHRARAKALRVALLFASAALAAVVLPGVAASQEKPSILLLPVVVHSSESPGYLRRGISDMLMARFQQAAEFDLIQIEDPAMATTAFDEAVEAGRSAGADFVLFGSFTRFGEGASLDMHAASTAPGGEEENLREIFVHSGQIGEVIPDLDDLVGKVARFAIEDYAPRAEGSTPSAPPAPGSRADLLRRVQELERAIEILQQKTPADAG